MDLPLAAKAGITVLAGVAAYFVFSYVTSPSSSAAPAAPAPSSTPSGGGSTYTPPKTTTPKTPDKSTANLAWGAGCRDGAAKGYADGYSGSGRNNAASASAASSSGNAAAYKAAFADSYDSGFFSGNAVAGVFGAGPDSSTGATAVSKLISGCAGKFETWFSSWLASGAPAG